MLWLPFTRYSDAVMRKEEYQAELIFSQVPNSQKPPSRAKVASDNITHNKQNKGCGSAMSSTVPDGPSQAAIIPPDWTRHPRCILENLLESVENEDPRTKEERILRITDYLYGSSTLDGAVAVLDKADTCIRKVVAKPSGRSAYLVQGSGSGRKKAGDTYFCLVDKTVYCTCRSYFERAKSDPRALCKHLLALMLLPSLGVSCNQETVADEHYASLLMNSVLRTSKHRPWRRRRNLL